MKILLCNWHMAIKTYLINFFHLLLKNLTSQSKCLEKRRFCEFIPLDMCERFSFYHFWIPQGIPFSKNIMFYPVTLGWNYCHFGGEWAYKHSLKRNEVDLQAIRIWQATSILDQKITIEACYSQYFCPEPKYSNSQSIYNPFI